MPPVAADAGQAVTAIPTPGLLYEPKWDGFRSIVFRDGDEVEIGSRNERPMTRYFPEVVEAVQANLPERVRRRRRDRRGRPGARRARLRGAAAAHPPRRQPGRACSPRRPRPASSPSTCSRSATTTCTGEPFAERRARARGGARPTPAPPVHLTPATDRPGARRAVVRRVRGRRARRRRSPSRSTAPTSPTSA